MTYTHITDLSTIRQLVLDLLAQPGRHTVGSVRRHLPDVSRVCLEHVLEGLRDESLIIGGIAVNVGGTPISLNDPGSAPALAHLVEPILGLLADRPADSARQLALDLGADLHQVRQTCDALVRDGRLRLRSTIGLLKLYSLPNS